MADEYRFLTVWRVPGSLAEVTDVLGNADTLPQWWPSVYLSVRRLEDGGPDWVGSVSELHTKGWLPYTLTWNIRLVEPVTDAGFAIEAIGDLKGSGRWTFEQDGPEVVITYDWRIEATKPLLRRLSWLLRPAFEANHRWAMARGEESLLLQLRRRRATTEEERRLVPPPPRPRSAACSAPGSSARAIPGQSR